MDLSDSVFTMRLSPHFSVVSQKPRVQKMDALKKENNNINNKISLGICLCDALVLGSHQSPSYSFQENKSF